MDKLIARKRRHKRIRTRIRAYSAHPRLVVFRSLKHIYAQVVDRAGRVLAATSDISKGEKLPEGKKLEHAQKVGETIAKLAIAKGVTHVAFDRAGYRYHGRVKALAEAARKAGLQF